MKLPWLFALIGMSAAIGAAQTEPAGPTSVSEIFNSGLATETALASSATLSYTVAHFPYGQGWSTRIALANNGKTDATVNMKFFNTAGAPTLVPLDGLGNQGSQQFVIHPNQTHVVGADLSQRNNGNLQVAWATTSSTAPLNVFSLFDFGPNPPAITGAVGAASMAPSKSFRFPVSVGGSVNYNAGMAISNPNGSQTIVTVKVLNADGTVKGTFPETLAANAQTIFLLNTKMNFGSSLFNGSVAVCAPNPVGLVALGVEGGSTGLFTIAVTTDPCP
jgi:hypothetical protein